MLYSVVGTQIKSIEIVCSWLDYLSNLNAFFIVSDQVYNNKLKLKLKTITSKYLVSKCMHTYSMCIIFQTIRLKRNEKKLLFL